MHRLEKVFIQAATTLTLLFSSTIHSKEQYIRPNYHSSLSELDSLYNNADSPTNLIEQGFSKSAETDYGQPALANPSNVPLTRLPPPLPSNYPLPNASRSSGAAAAPAYPADSFNTVEQETYAINFNNVGIIEYIRYISKISNINFVFQDSDLQFNVTIVSEEPTSIENIMAALIQILRVRGLSMTQQGNNLIIFQNADISKISTVISEDGQYSPTPLITRVIRLVYVNPDKVKNIIQPLLSSQAVIEISPETRHIIITDLATNIDKVMLLLHSLDTPNTAIEVGSYTTQFTAPLTLLSIAEKIIAPISIAEATPVALVPQPTTNTIFIISTPDLIYRSLSILQSLDKPGMPNEAIEMRQTTIEVGNYIARYQPPGALIPVAERIIAPIVKMEGIQLSLVAQPSTNSIFIISSPEIIQRALIILRSLDQPIPEPLSLPPPPDIPPSEMQGSIFYVYKLHFHRGDQIELAIQEMGESLARSGLANPDLISAITSMRWIEPTNSLVFVGTPPAIDKIKQMLHTLDRAPKQVFIEVLVIQTSLANSLNFGVEWGTKVRDDSSLFIGSGLFQNSSTFSPNFTTPAPTAPVIALGQGFNYGIIGDLITHNGEFFGSIGALLQALQTETQTKILLNPKIVTEDNSPAQVFVGQNIPFTTANVEIQASNNSTGFTVDYRDVGVLLEVTPYLGAGDIVTIELHQEISQISTTSVLPNLFPTSVNGFPIPTTNKTFTTTRVHIPSNYFLIISGMIQNQKTYTKSGIPCLGCLPVASGAFSQQAESEVKQNVIIFLHPRIINNRCDIGELTDQQGYEYELKSAPIPCKVCNGLFCDCSYERAPIPYAQRGLTVKPAEVSYIPMANPIPGQACPTMPLPAPQPAPTPPPPTKSLPEEVIYIPASPASPIMPGTYKPQEVSYIPQNGQFNYDYPCTPQPAQAFNGEATYIPAPPPVPTTPATCKPPEVTYIPAPPPPPVTPGTNKPKEVTYFPQKGKGKKNFNYEYPPTPPRSR